jgi:hypothetical protein
VSVRCPALGLDFRVFPGDSPLVTVKTDDRKRVVLPNAAPGDVFNVDFSTDGKITLTKLVPAETKIVRARTVNGRLTGAAIKLDRATVAAAVRAERDER